MVLALNLVRNLITLLLVIWIVIGITDIVITNIYSNQPLFHFYLLFPTGFPSILVYFIIAFLSILTNKSYHVIDYVGIAFGPYTYTLKDAIREHWDCNRSVLLSAFLITFVATISFGFSPLLTLPIVIWTFAKRAKKRMEAIPLCGMDVFATMRDINHSFIEGFISLIPKSNLLWHNPLYLRCLYFTMYHLNLLHTENDTDDDRKVYLNSLMSIIALNDSASNNYIMNRSVSNKLDNIWRKYFCELHFDNHYNKAPFSGYNAYARGYVCLLIYIFIIEIGLFWLIMYTASTHYDNENILMKTWLIRDVLHFILLVLIIWMYFEHIKSEIKYRYCWKHPRTRSFGNFSDKRCWYLIHNILWFNIVADKLDEYIVNVVDGINDTNNIKWMKQIIIEYCIGVTNDEWYSNMIAGQSVDKLDNMDGKAKSIALLQQIKRN